MPNKENIEDQSLYRGEAPTNAAKYLRVENEENEVTPIQDSVIIDSGCCSVSETIIFLDPPIKTHYNGKYIVLDRGENEIYWEKNGKEISEKEVWAGTSIGTYYPKKHNRVLCTSNYNLGYAGYCLSKPPFDTCVVEGKTKSTPIYGIGANSKCILTTIWGINN